PSAKRRLAEHSLALGRTTEAAAVYLDAGRDFAEFAAWGNALEALGAGIALLERLATSAAATSPWMFNTTACSAMTLATVVDVRWLTERRRCSCGGCACATDCGAPAERPGGVSRFADARSHRGTRPNRTPHRCCTAHSQPSSAPRKESTMR
ncbi:MAG: hypothetical protein ACXVAK_18500, partial [Vulcanimicrobiaceae bacterium]